ncbi:GNAT family N-acetyltransferase [Phytomonospora endophytica]|uniref:Phosphinothricin acetyltransferase n=1 Tax=Phytomonospora endophytica TaxID=714109 RepID=A0A841FN41_9ACTN|nr:GNAT family N-acetyltransferase [Phytomonospora endophytica]MBB6033360.1 phosphinothricin acetyltransferase [Phytomonospora endophytica]GIG70868.1 phosphinothricin N-acetyltransferase [Phytomonospora endophytica]
MTTTRAPRLTITQMTDAHARQVLAIYQAGIDTGNATFETAAPDWTRFCVGKLLRHRFVATEGAHVLGWIAGTATSKRPAYAGVVEHSVYVRPDAAGRGVGRALLETFIASTEAAGIWTITTSIFPENTASLALHARTGFRTVGVRERVGRLRGVWRDTVMLERRSGVVGVG